MVDLDAIRMPFDPDGSLLVLQVVLGVIMYGVALELTPGDFRQLVRDPRGPLIGLLCQCVLLPAVAFPLAIWSSPLPSMALGLILVAACPGGALSNFLTSLARGRVSLSVGMSGVSTLLAVVTTPLNFAFWGSLHPSTAALMRDVSLDPLDMGRSVAVMLLVPVLLGMATTQWAPTVSARLQPWMRRASVVFFAGIVVVGFAMNFDTFVKGIGMTFVPVALVNAAAFALGWVGATLAGLPEAERRAVSIEVGIQNSGLALVLIFTYFDGLGGMAGVATWWGVWHLVAGFAVVGLFRLRDRHAGPVTLAAAPTE
jgi:BASS family bile acid:Na+ symporter